LPVFLGPLSETEECLQLAKDSSSDTNDTHEDPHARILTRGETARSNECCEHHHRNAQDAV
jgi:hypothetical protein